MAKCTQSSHFGKAAPVLRKMGARLPVSLLKKNPRPSPGMWQSGWAADGWLAGRQAGRLAGWHVGRLAGRQAGRLAGWQAGRWQAGRQVGRQAGR